MGTLRYYIFLGLFLGFMFFHKINMTMPILPNHFSVSPLFLYHGSALNLHIIHHTLEKPLLSFNNHIINLQLLLIGFFGIFLIKRHTATGIFKHLIVDILVLFIALIILYFLFWLYNTYNIVYLSLGTILILISLWWLKAQRKHKY